MHVCAYNSLQENQTVDVEWDSNKARANLQKHGVDFSDAATVLHDELALTLLTDFTLEERYATLGADALGRILVVIYAYRGDNIRLISARKATARERAGYRKRK